MGRNDEFFHGVSVWEHEKRLVQTKSKRRKTTALTPGDMGADDVDYEMQFEKDPYELEIIGMNQSGLERFVERYGSTYRWLGFFHCPHISDFSPLEDLKGLEMVGIDWNIHAQRLWDMSKNPELWSFRLSECKKLTYSLDDLRSAKCLRNVKVVGPMDGRYPMRSLDCFAGIPSLEKLVLMHVKPEDRNTDFLGALPSLREFNFDPGMFTTEEIAKMVAMHPDLHGKYLCAYAEDFGDMRVSGYRKPTLSLPKDQKRLDRYTAEFEALVERYREESSPISE